MKRILRLLNRFGMGRTIALVLLIDLALLRIWDALPVEALRLRTFDAYQLIAPRVATQRPVLIIDIDEDSLKALGQWPWPRTMVAEMVTRVTQMGAVAIGFDVVFAEADRSSPALAADTFHGLDEETRAKLKALPSNDAVLAEAIGNSRVVLGQTALARASAAPADDLPQTGFAVVGVRGLDVEPPLLEFPGLLRNIPELENAAAGRGLFTIRPEADGIVRRVPIVMLADGLKVPSLSVELLRVVSGAGAILIKMDEAGLQSVAFGRRGLEIATDRRGQLWVHFSPHDKSRFVSAKDVLSGAADPARFKGKIVLVGTSAIGLLDLKTTPVDPTMPGVEVHAQLLESMLSGASLTSPSYATLAELAIATLVGLAIIAPAPVLGAWSLFWVGGAMAALLVGVSWYYFAQRNLLIDFTFPLIASSLIYLTLVFTNSLRAHSERRQIRSAFGQYLSPVLVEQLAQSPEKLVLGGEERVMTVLFSDVRGFTTIAEQYKDDPQGLTHLMNRLLTPLTNAIVDRKGTIDKIHRRRHHGVLECAARRRRAGGERLRGGLAHARGARAPQRRAPRRGRGRGPSLPAHEGRHRHQHWPLPRRQHGLGPALQLFGPRRRREPRGAARIADEELRRRDPDRGAHRSRGRTAFHRARARPPAGQGQDRARAHLHHRRPGGRARRLRGARRAQRRDAGALSRPRLAEVSGDDPTLPRARAGGGAGGILQSLC